MTDKTELEVTLGDPARFGGGIANAMRALRYRVTPPSDPEDCTAWEVHCPDGVTILLAKDEAEAWETADRHLRQAGLMEPIATRTPDPTPAVPDDGLVERMAQAISPKLQPLFAPAMADNIARELAEAAALAAYRGEA